ncbi:MAG: hypothetical protein H0T73_06530 [Ardenticatenales bacterium]|nr:hypothetical protein [Ardenticatenales bacterium]
MKTENITLFFSLLALGWGFWNHRRASQTQERLENVRNSHFRLADQMREQVGKLEDEVRSLHQQLRTAKGGATLFHAEMTIAEAMTVEPRATEVLGAFHIGGCSSCAVSPEDTLRQAAEANEQNIQQVLEALNKLAGSEAADVQSMLERRPNVQISL